MQNMYNTMVPYRDREISRCGLHNRCGEVNIHKGRERTITLHRNR